MEFFCKKLSQAKGTVVVFRPEIENLPKEEQKTALNVLVCLAQEIGFADLPEFSGREGKVHFSFSPSGREFLQVGLGKNPNLSALQKALALLVQTCSVQEIEQISLCVDGLFLPFQEAVFESVLALLLASYSFDEFVAEKKSKTVFPKTVTLVGDAAEVAPAQDIFSAVKLIRDLVNIPANVATPKFLANIAEELAKDFGFSCQVFTEQECEKMKMGCFASVFRGSEEPACFIVLDSNPGSQEPPLVFVGKGVTFDTGGISLKPAANMHEMKSDMAGAATILGLFRLLGLRREKRRLVGILPCTENVPGNLATKPGDVVFAMNGKSVEILNTDAEGRLILADGLCFSEKFKPSAVVDLATLTGACVVALGETIAGLFSNDEKLASVFIEQGRVVGEDFWRLPLPDDYQKDLKSDVADLKNMGKREGGAIYAALFLQNFVPENTPWVHLDIAGPARSKKDCGIIKVGGTGFALRTLWNVVQNYS